ncbi:MAG: PIN domain-containing protein [Gemmataceae bacterium]|nr:PIN domain-containing protein [Gemmataceae bacterium]MCI0742267.1 PIN domain-containing protein [Gemmataceae bacterium]
MSRRVMDTSVLVSFWIAKTAKNKAPSAAQTRIWAQELIVAHKTDVIVTPVLVEFLAGAQSREEATLFQAFLQSFVVLDEREITSADWNRALHYAQKIPRDGKRRQLGDCLIRAIADRFRRSVLTLERGFPK